MVSGFPGYFIVSQCPSGCLAPSSPCMVCHNLGSAVCISHSVVPYYRATARDSVVVRRDRDSVKHNIRSVCGDIIVYLSAFNGKL